MIVADAYRRRGVAKVGDLDPTSSRAVAEYLSVLDDATFGAATPTEPKSISPTDPAARDTAAADTLAVYAYSDNYLNQPGRTIDGHDAVNEGVRQSWVHYLRATGHAMSKGINRSNAGELKPFARTFLEAYQAAAAKTDEDFRRIITGNTGYQHFEGGLVELTDQVIEATDALVSKAVSMIGPKGSSERALTAFAEEVGKDLVAGDLDLDQAITRLIEKFSQESNASYEIILPNYLIHLNEGVRSLDMGRVRAALTEDVAVDLSKRRLPLTITVGPELSESIRDKNLALTMPGSCWVVKLAAAKDNANEEAKWLIDVALSLLRMSYKLVGPMFPMVGDIEPYSGRAYWRPPGGLGSSPLGAKPS